MKAKKFTGRHASRKPAIRALCHGRPVEYCLSTDGRVLSETIGLPDHIAKPNGNDVVAWRRYDGQVCRPAGRASLFAVVRKHDYTHLKYWAKCGLVKLGEPYQAPDDYPSCLVVEVKGDGHDLKGRSWIVELWHTIPKMRVVS